ncbi:hypothetical protein VCHC65A1_03312A, partial [Vibrio cholerae HC-65A1]|jgi:hypothetical protein
MLSI